MSTTETLFAIDGLLGPRAAEYLDPGVELWDAFGDETLRGRADVMRRLAGPLESIEERTVDVRSLTIDIGRGAAEWLTAGYERRDGQRRRVAFPAAVVCEIESGLIHRIRLYANPTPMARAERPTPVALTERQREIAVLVAEGFTNAEIATRLFLSPRTVDYHLRALFQKFGFRSRTELAVWMKERNGRDG
jgi:DNA-binding CsgD family transcriptional regulator